jgi:hypothetical protein
MPFRGEKFNKNQYSSSHNLLNGANENFPYSCYLATIQYRIYPKKIFVTEIFSKIGEQKPCLTGGASMNFIAVLSVFISRLG